MKTKTEIDIYEIDGKETKIDHPILFIENHWNRKQYIVLSVNGQKITVLSDELKRAIDNAQNAHP